MPPAADPSADDALILGGGPAGLATGWALAERNRGATVLEAAAVPGGQARTLEFGDFRCDTGPHRFHDRDPAVTRRVMALVGSDLQEVAAPSRILWQGRFVDFPLRPAQLLGAGGLRTGLDMLRARLSGRGQAAPADFESFAVGTFGRAIADAFLIPFSEKLWGLPARELSPEIAGRRLPGFSLRAIAAEVLLGRRGHHLEGRFLYPRRGYGQIVDAMAARLAPGSLRCGTRVRGLTTEGDRIAAVAFEGPDGPGVIRAPAAVVNTLPITLVAGMLDPAPPEDVLAAARALRFRDLILLVLLLDQPAVSDAACIYFAGRDLPFTRAHEPRNRSAAMSPPGRTSLVIEFPCFAGDAVWQRDEAALTAETIAQLEELGLLRAARVTGSAVVRLRQAYPVYARDYRASSERVLGHLRRFRNLWTIGRGGSFFYGHVHDFIGDGFRIAAELSS